MKKETLSNYILAFDEINALTAVSYHTASETTEDKTDQVNQIVDDVLSLLINAYRKGMKAASDMLAYDLTVDVNNMDEIIYMVIDGKTFEDRIADHVLNGDLEGLQTLTESEFHRVYNAAVLDGGHQYKAEVGYGVTKNWYTVMDNRVRETHRYLEGASVDIDEEFWTFDGDHAAYPGGFTKASNNVNCRCTVELHIDAEGD